MTKDERIALHRCLNCGACYTPEAHHECWLSHHLGDEHWTLESRTTVRLPKALDTSDLLSKSRQLGYFGDPYFAPNGAGE